MKYFTLFIFLICVTLLASCSPPAISPTHTPAPALATSIEPIQTPNPSKYQVPGDYVETIDVDGTERMFLVHIPPGYQPDIPIPLIFNIHGRTDTAQHQQEMTQMNAKADEAGFVVVAPQAIDDPPTWWGAVPTEIGEPDMNFFDAMLAHLDAEINIDPARIYATGFSNGASLANRLACSRSDIFAAVAPVSGGHVGYYDCDAQYAVSVLVIHGLNDSVIPYWGNQYNPQVYDWVGAWAERNGCAGIPTTNQPIENLTLEFWKDCNGDTLVALYSIANGGHTWPGSDFAIEFDGTTQAIDATEVIWMFFEAHPRTSLAPVQPPAPTTEPAESNLSASGDYFEAIESGGFDRTFKLHIPPSYEPGTEIPLMLVFHGRGSNAFDAEQYLQLNPLADQEGFIVAYPQATGSPTTWEYLPGDSESGIDDIQFVDDLLVHLSSQLSIDAGRIYAAGFSNGGGMANRLACDLSEKIAAIVPVAGAYYYWEECQPSRPVPVLAFHGLRDEIVPYEGTDYEDYANLPEIHLWASAWAERNGCAPESVKESKGGVITIDTWIECAGASEVILYSLALDGHNWPTTNFGGGGFEPAIMVNNLIWEFFAAHPIPDSTETSLSPLSDPSITQVPDNNPTIQPATARITILYDSTSFDNRLTADWGFSALIEYGAFTLLFDSGANGEILKGNAALLGIDLTAIDAIVLSHEHRDHTGGIDEVGQSDSGTGARA